MWKEDYQWQCCIKMDRPPNGYFLEASYEPLLVYFKCLAGNANTYTLNQYNH
jgi:hypothetical protein